MAVAAVAALLAAAAVPLPAVRDAWAAAGATPVSMAAPSATGSPSVTTSLTLRDTSVLPIVTPSIGRCAIHETAAGPDKLARVWRVMDRCTPIPRRCTP